MALLDWLPWRRQETRALSAEQFKSMGIFDMGTTAGVSVTTSNALTLPAYWSGVNLISNAIAKLPRKVYRTVADGAREEADGHPIGWMIQQEPNEYSTPFVFWRTLMAHVLTWGNGYAEIERDGAYRPISLLTLTPDRVEPVLERGVLWYVLDGQKRIPSEDMLHIPGLGFDGIKGYSVVERLRQTLGLAFAAEQYGAAFFGNGAAPGVILKHPKTLTKDAADRLKESWNAAHRGVSKAHRAVVAEEGMDVTVLPIPAKDAQLIETRQLSVDDVARILNLDPAFLGRSGERPGGNYESSRLGYLDNTLDPWLVAIEQEANRKLLSKQQRGTYYVEHVRAAILRTDAQTRATVQKTYVDMGAMTPEYVAKLENLPKPPEKKPEPAPAPAQGAAADPAPADPQPRSLAVRVAFDVVGRLTKLEADRARRAAAQGPQKLQAWVDEFYPGHEIRLREALEPVVRGWCEDRGRADWEGPLEALVSGMVAQSRDDLLGAKAGVLEADVEARVSRWERERPGAVAQQILEVA